jgi:hypothetical protein|tara:strand:+ start:41 stop:289 length:249 start_codon:yes stop_codon:yes gene_type:complete
MKPPPDKNHYHVQADDPWVNNFVDFLRPLCDNNGELSKEKLLEITGWDPLQTPWGYDLPFCYDFKVDQKFYIVLKKERSKNV